MLASVDVGTNTVRLLIGKVSDGRIEPLHILRRITRLGGGFDPRKGLSPEAVERTLKALHEMADLCRRTGVRHIDAVGTAILRNARDGSAFAARVRSETGLPLEIIGGEEEARLTALGVRSVIDPVPDKSLIIDIGGGSTEFVLMSGEDRLFLRSYPLGVVSLCESFPDPAEQARHISEIFDALIHDLEQESLIDIVLAPGCSLIGTAGTITTLAALKLRMSEYEAALVNNLRLSQHELQAIFSELEPLPPEERELRPGMEKGRGDLILPGLRIVLCALERLHLDSLTISDAGLLEGVLLSSARQTSINR